MSATDNSNNRIAPNGRGFEDVWKYPRPAKLEETPLRLRVVWEPLEGESLVLADTTKGYRVLETSHPPTYYLPKDDVKMEYLVNNSRHSFCEWKGQASYFDFKIPTGQPIKSRIWTYINPNKTFAPIRNYLSFYASSSSSKANEAEHTGRWKCYVGDEEVQAQDGDFYGGWITNEIQGKIKGGPGTQGW